MKLLMDLDDDLAHEIVKHALDRKQTFEQSVHELIRAGLKHKETTAPKMSPAEVEDMLDRHVELKIANVYSHVLRRKLNRVFTFDELLTDKQNQWLTKAKRASWRRFFHVWALKREAEGILAITQPSSSTDGEYVYTKLHPINYLETEVHTHARQ